VEAADDSVWLVAVTVAVVGLNLRTGWHPLWLLAGGTVAGLVIH
jgi:hypothetical protein